MKNALILIFTLISLRATAQYYKMEFGTSINQQERIPELQIPGKLVPMISFNAHYGYDWKIFNYLSFGLRIAYDKTGIEYKNPDFNQSFSYLELEQKIKIKSPYVPAYFGIGCYQAILMSASQYSGGKTSYLPTNMYQQFDYGLLPLIGAELDFDFFTLYIEGQYKFGIADIDKTAQSSIKNRSILVLLGISFLVF